MFRHARGNLLQSFQVKTSIRNIVNACDRINERVKHVYYQKTLTKNELLEHLKNNVVYESDSYVATNVPVGLPFKKNKTWVDTVSPLVAEVDYNDIFEDLPVIFNSPTARLTKYPRRNASGVAIFSKTFNDSNKLLHSLSSAASTGRYVFTFLTVVLGRPPPLHSGVFGLKPVKVGEQYGTEVLTKFDPKKIQKTHYTHEVLASSELLSLVKVELSNDNRDCVRHILASCCLTPILGDYWNYSKKKSLILGVPVTLGASAGQTDSIELNSELLSKLQLQPGEEKLIPIHSHLYCVKTILGKKKILIVSAPPPEPFVWTCRQFGFNEIHDFIPSGS